MKFKNILPAIIKDLSSKFQNDELAFLALTSKIEFQLRDKIAFELQKELTDEYLVCREWKPKGSNQRIDLAVLNKVTNKMECLIEFKAQSVIKYSKEFSDHFKKDVAKMRSFSKHNPCEIFYIHFNNWLKSSNPLNNNLKESVKYFNDLQQLIYSKKNPSELAKESWIKMLENNTISQQEIDEHLTPIYIQAGKFQDIPVDIITFMYCS